MNEVHKTRKGAVETESFIANDNPWIWLFESWILELRLVQDKQTIVFAIA